MAAGFFALGIPCHCKPFCCSGWAAESAEQTIRGLENKPHGPVEVKANAAYRNRIKKSLKPAVTLSLVPSASCCALLYWA